jgi:activator of HSP90 ATPase
MANKNIAHKIQFKAKANVLFDLLIDSQKHSNFTGAEAIISNQIGGEYSTYDGYIVGKNLELVPGKRIVQTWKAQEEGWPDDVYSIVEFVFTENKNGTELMFRHTDIPSMVKSDFDSGWKEHYWEPMKAYLNE